jgi:hypothetical protein
VSRIPIGHILKPRGLIDDAQLLGALAMQGEWGVPLGEALLRLGLLREDQLLSVLAQQSGAPVVCIGDRVIDDEVLRLVPEDLVRNHHVLPLRVSTRTLNPLLLVATPPPSDPLLLDEVELAAGMPVVPTLASSADLAQAIARHFDEAAG